MNSATTSVSFEPVAYSCESALTNRKCEKKKYETSYTPERHRSAKCKDKLMKRKCHARYNNRVPMFPVDGYTAKA